MDWTATVLGAVIGALVGSATFLASGSIELACGGIALGGFVTGLASGNVGDEFLDGAVAAALGLVPFLGLLFVLTMELYAGAVADRALVSGVVVFGYVLVASPFVAVGGAITGRIGGTIHRGPLRRPNRS